MRIMFISNLYPPNQVGGYEELCWEVASQFGARGHEVSVLTSANGGKICEFPGQNISQALRLLVGKSVYDAYDGPAFRRETISAQNRHNLIQAVRKTQPEVIFCWNLHGLGVDFFGTLAELPIPVVAMLTDNWLGAMFNSKFIGRFFRNAVYRNGNETDYLGQNTTPKRISANVSAIFGSHFMEKFYAASGLRFKQSSVVHNGVNLPSLEPQRSKEIAKNRVDLLFAGRVVEIKGAHTAIAALGRLVKLRPETDWRLNMVGDTRDAPYLQLLQQQAKDNGVADKVTFPGRVAAEDLTRLFDHHDIYLFPSLYEPFSLTLIHAMASGIPTVASDIGGNGEIVREGVTGLLFAKADVDAMTKAVINLVDDPALAQRLGQAGAKRARSFSTEQMIDAMEQHLIGRIGGVNA
jgi:glycogen synthase